MKPSLLIIDDEKNTREALKRLLASEYEIYLASGVDEALQSIDKIKFDSIITDLRLGGNTSGLTIVQNAAKKNIPCIMMTAFGDVDTAVTAMRFGAFDFITKPINFQKLKITIKQSVTEYHTDHFTEHNTSAQHFIPNPIETIPEIIATDTSPFRKLLEEAQRVAHNRANVLLLGETGTGKEILAQAIHQKSQRNGPLVPVHCAALSPTLLESELFGHEKGAFTGAIERRIGKFEAANKGTLFLDEIGEIDLSIQVKLLRFLETKSFERIGSNETINVDVRIISATNRNLQQMIHDGTFREDLYYRLNVIEFKIPPLRERIMDIPPLFEHYIHFFEKENNLPSITIDENVFSKLIKYSWPGNIRELKNVCESIIALLPEGQTIITASDLGEKFV